MKNYRIKHEDKRILIVLIFFTVMVFVSVPALILSSEIDLNAWRWNIYITVASFAGMFLSMIIYFIDMALGTVIAVDDHRVILKRLLGRRTIAMEHIDDLDIDDYHRIRRHRIEYRKKMTLYLQNGKKVVLKDNASYIENIMGFILGERSQLPDEKIPLYNAYKDILTRLNSEAS